MVNYCLSSKAARNDRLRDSTAGTLHGALGSEISDFLQGTESAEQALADVEAAYTAAAKEKGFLK